MTDQTKLPTDNEQPIDMAPIARLIGFVGMFVAHVECAAGYQYGQARPAALKSEPDHLDEIMRDEKPVVAFMGSGASDMLFIKDVVAAREAYVQLMKAFGVGQDIHPLESYEAWIKRGRELYNQHGGSDDGLAQWEKESRGANSYTEGQTAGAWSLMAECKAPDDKPH